MRQINTLEDLSAAIIKLESKKTAERELLRKDFQLAYESIKPINLIKSTFKEVTQSQNIKDNLLNSGIGLVAGTVVKAVFVGVSHNPIRKLFGTALMFGITNVITKNPKMVKTVSMAIMNLVSVKSDTEESNDFEPVEDVTYV